MRTAIIGALIVLASCGPDSDVSRSLGARCDVTAECDDRCLSPSPEYPDGFCTIDCSSAGDCPSDAECIDREGGVCLFACFDDLDCGFLGVGWTCKERDLRADPSIRSRVCIGE